MDDRSRHFRAKATIADVTQPGVASLVIDGSRSLLENVPERTLETALPSSGGHVLVVAGRYRGQRGILMERLKDGRAACRLDSDDAIVDLDRDDVAELVDVASGHSGH